MTEREVHVRKTDQIISRLMELWPIWMLLAGGLVTAINFYNTVNNLANDEKSWKQTIEARRDANRKEEEAIEIRLTKLETDLDWIKKDKK